MAGIQGEQEGVETARALAAIIEEAFQRSFDFSQPVVYFPLRHHSPACSIHLERVIDACGPEIILIEGPSDANHLIPLISDPSSVPPFAVYYSYDDREGRVSAEKEKYRAYYPFLEYSPEYLALMKAAALGIPAHFIDMPYAARLVNIPDGGADGGRGRRFNEDREFEVNAYTAALARNAGFRSYAEFWEAFYEIPAGDMESAAFVRSLFHIVSYMRLAEGGGANGVANTEGNEDPEVVENRLREEWMAREIAAAAKNLSPGGRVLAVTGAFHVPGLLALAASTGSGSGEGNLKPHSAKDAAAYLMPYSFAGMDSRKGYAAGMPFPAYYQAVWEATRKADRKTPPDREIFARTASDFIIKTARFTRKTNPVSIPDEVNALALSSSLAKLRGKAAPGVYELLDGVQSAFVKGDIHGAPTGELDYLLGILSGLGAGRTASSSRIPPIVLNFRELCREHRIKTDTILRQETTLDILKNPGHGEKSRFLHQMVFLETGFSKRLSGPDYVSGESRNLVREIWEYRWDPKVETVLIDQSVFGATLNEACVSIAARRFRDSMTAEELGKLLLQAEVIGLPNFWEAHRDDILDVLDREERFVNAVFCLSSLRNLKNLRRLLGQSGSEEALVKLLEHCHRRGVDLLEEGKTCAAGEERKTCEALKSLYTFTAEEGEPMTEVFADRVEVLLSSGFQRGRFYGTLLGIHEKQGRIDPGELARRFKARLESSLDDPGEAASFIAGVFLISRDLLFGGFEIMKELDRIISRLDDESFLAALPNFRQAFTLFLPRELDRLGRVAAELHGLSAENTVLSERVSQEELARGMVLDGKAVRALARWGLGKNPLDPPVKGGAKGENRG